MTADEFEVRYAAMPELKKAELLEGVVYMPSPVRLDAHGKQHLRLAGWLATYLSLTPGVEGGDNTTARLNKLNQPQPDLLLFLPTGAGGQAIVAEDGYLTGAPEFVSEVASSSRSYDLGAKKNVYTKFGVKEYVIWQVEENGIEWFVLQDGQYTSRAPDPDEMFRSTVFPGLWLDWKALLTGDLARVFAVVQQGCATPEHKAFVERLAAAKA
jgi:Uma2 family endonuclease